MALILDALLIAVVAVFVLFGIKRGFIKSFVSLLGIIISLAIAFYLSTPISNFIFSNILRNPIHDKITETISAQLPDSANKDDIKLEIPEELLSLAKSLGIDVDSYFSKMSDGTWKLIGDAEAFANLVNGYGIDELVD